MIYIIDANNLAGKLNILKEVDFDKILIDIIEAYNQGKGKKIFLVFDGIDPNGDKYEIDNIVVIRTPRDDYYKTADDKIVELAENCLADYKDEIIVITDDLEIKKLVKEINLNSQRQVGVISATDFAGKLNYLMDKATEKDEKEIDESNVESLNDELLEIWKNN